jgi:hypothetical protein
MNSDLITTSIRIQPEKLKEIKLLAVKNDISMGEFFRQAIDEKLTKLNSNSGGKGENEEKEHQQKNEV